ncbi:M23 family metallopeptidase [Sphingosinicella sp. LHD-64]|uniref:M23 family metallopeptidase n=1 Tax=Sphingosinicella sp. LHD-64 TaxID=3072139 RepID=UPI00280E6AD7|nr:M23 family metallopeptidase [Sphingosinicella sp. LHD-64]MDQ8756477.1 M23 family metallopeptidase [Sphingosinicella sp. LHD-64]
MRAASQRVIACAIGLFASAGIAQGPPDHIFQLYGEPGQGALLRARAPAGTQSLTLDGRHVPVAPDGRFLVGFDRDAPSSMRLVARLADGTEVAQIISVAARIWPIQRVNMARPSDGPTPEFRRRRERELARIGAARARRSDSMGWTQRLIWPARGRISGRFGAQRIYRGVPAAYHSGTDIAAGAGAIVFAPADGAVVLASPPMFSLEGNLVIIDHGMGLSSAFLHLARAHVREGEVVRQGQPIGVVGATGRATGPHLHWSLVWNGARLDPQAAAGAME